MSESSRRILLAVGGGIAAFKAAALCSQLVQAEYQVRVAMTRAATRFVGPATFAALSSHPVATDESASDQFPLGAHIELTREIDVVVVAPCTANLIAKFASGIADDLVSTTYLQAACPVVVAPAMSANMWNHAAVRRNVELLRSDGVRMVGPGTGWLSCRDRGTGRMVEPEAVVSALSALFDRGRPAE